MSLKAGSCWLLSFVVVVSASGQQANQRSQIDSALTREVDTVIRIASALHPGMTRADVLENFKTEGGLSTRK
jgi:hypothetical protein